MAQSKGEHAFSFRVGLPIAGRFSECRSVGRCAGDKVAYWSKAHGRAGGLKAYKPEFVPKHLSTRRLEQL